MHGVVEMSPRKLPPEHAPMGKTLLDEMHMREDPLVTKGDASMLRKPKSGGPEPPQEPLRNLQDAAPKSQAKRHFGTRACRPAGARRQGPREPVTIDLLVAYTRKAASHYTDIKRDLIEVAVEEANQSFRNSGIDNVRLRLVHTYQTDYVEEGSHFEHVFRFADKGDGYMDEVHALRDQHKADIAALIVDDPQRLRALGCGGAAGRPRLHGRASRVRGAELLAGARDRAPHRRAPRRRTRRQPAALSPTVTASSPARTGAP